MYTHKSNAIKINASKQKNQQDSEWDEKHNRIVN